MASCLRAWVSSALCIVNNSLDKALVSNAALNLPQVIGANFHFPGFALFTLNPTERSVYTACSYCPFVRTYTRQKKFSGLLGPTCIANIIALFSLRIQTLKYGYS